MAKCMFADMCKYYTANAVCCNNNSEAKSYCGAWVTFEEVRIKCQ